MSNDNNGPYDKYERYRNDHDGDHSHDHDQDDDALSIKVVSGTYNAKNDDWILLVNVSLANATINLPKGLYGKQFIIVDKNLNCHNRPITLVPKPGETIQGNTTIMGLGGKTATSFTLEFYKDVWYLLADQTSLSVSGGGGSGANMTLSNLTAPIALNQNLVGGVHLARSLGTDAITFNTTKSQFYRSSNTVTSFTGTSTAANPVITTANTTGLFVGMGIITPTNALGSTGAHTIVSIVPNVSITLSANASTAQTSVQFFGVYTIDAQSSPQTGSNPSGHALFASGSVVDGKSGGAFFYSGDASGTAGSSSTVQLRSGAHTNAANTIPTGSVLVASGTSVGSGATGILNVLSGISSGTGNTGSVTVRSGVAIGSAGSSGAATFSTGLASNGNTGMTTLSTGNAALGNSGAVLIQTGTANGTRGKIRIVDGSESAGAGSVWTATDASGNGTWAVPASANDWDLAGNTLTGTPTAPNEFMGSNSDHDIIVRTNGVEAARLKSTTNGLQLGVTDLGGTLASSGQGALAMGYALSPGGDISATGPGALAGGFTNTYAILAGNEGALAFGVTNADAISATGGGSFAMGLTGTGAITASGQASFAHGDNLSVTAVKAQAFGIGHLNNSYGAMVVGTYADASAATPGNMVATDPAFIVGKGTSTGSRANGLRIDKDGKATTTAAQSHTAIRSTNANTALSERTDRTLLIDTVTAGGAVNVELPIAPDNGLEFFIKDSTGNASTNAIQIQIVGGQLFENSTSSASISTNFGGQHIQYLNGVWYSIGKTNGF